MVGIRAPAELLLARVRGGIGPVPFSMFRLWQEGISEWSAYIDNLHLDAWQRQANPLQYRRLVDDKIEFYRHCRASGLPTPPILGLIKSDPDESADDFPVIQSGSELERVLAASESGLFFKPIGGRHGLGVFAAIRCGAGVSSIAGDSSTDEFYRYCVERARESGTLIVQPRIRPARRLLEITSAHGLATVRAVTYLDGETARLFLACLRIPVGRSEADNFRHGASGNLVAGLDAATGRLTSAVGSLRRDWPQIVDVDRHPDTGAPLVGFDLPSWREVVELVLEAQRRFVGLRSIGWDVAITDQGPMLIEGNGRYDCDILQLAHGRGLKSELRRILAPP